MADNGWGIMALRDRVLTARYRRVHLRRLLQGTELLSGRVAYCGITEGRACSSREVLQNDCLVLFIVVGNRCLSIQTRLGFLFLRCAADAKELSCISL